MALLLLALMALPAAAAALPTLQAEEAPDEEFCTDCCSLYCAAFPELEVSRQLASQAGHQYGAPQLRDGDGKTAWITAGGTSEWFEFVFKAEGLNAGKTATEELGVDRVYLWNGYNQSARQWKDHARVRELELSLDGVAVARLELLDVAKPQRVALPRTVLKPGMRFRFTVRQIYPGATFQETALSEVRLDGFGHH